MWEDIDLEAGTLTVCHTKTFAGQDNDAPVLEDTKSAAGRRTITLPAITVAALTEERQRNTSPYVLCMKNGKSLTRSSYRGLWAIVENRTAAGGRKIGDQKATCKGGTVTVSLDFTCHPHQLRHTCITNWFEQGMDLKQVQYLAGHTTPDMTLRVYTHYRRKSREQETADKVSAAVSCFG